MALITSILTGGSNNHETTSEEANGLYTDILSEGVAGSLTNTNGFAPTTGGFAINEQSTPAMAVDVSAGVIYVNGTPSTQNSQNFRIKNDATAAVAISSNVSGSTKYDWVYIELDATNLNTPNAAGDNAASLTVSRSTSSVTDDGTPPTYGYPIAVVTVANGASQIDDEDIRDKRLGVAVNAKQGTLSDGWNAFSDVHSVATGYNAGNRSFTIDTSTDVSGFVSEGMRYKVTRGTTPPTQCADLESSSSQYASKSSPAGISFTTTYTAEAWVKLESYGAYGVVSQFNGTNGWIFSLTSSGQVQIYGKGTGGTDQEASYQSIPLNKWVHIAGTLNATTNSYVIYIDGVAVPTFNTATTCTSITQAGNLQTGAYNGGNTFDGKIADVRVWSDIRTATEIKDNMFAYPLDTTGLVAHFKLNGDFTDSSSNGNDLTASGGALATNADNPWNATEYGIVTKITSSQLTVFCPEGYGIPNETLTAPFYSTQDCPFGFPRGEGKWTIQTLLKAESTQATPTNTVWYNVGSGSIAVPIGAWKLGYSADAETNDTGASNALQASLGTSTSTGLSEFIRYFITTIAGATSIGISTNFQRENYLELTSATTYYLNLQSTSNEDSIVMNPDGVSESIIRATCAYL